DCCDCQKPHLEPAICTRAAAPRQGRTDNSWGPQAIGDHGAPVSLPKLKKAYEKGTRDISWGPLLTPGPPNGQSAPAPRSLPPHWLNNWLPLLLITASEV
ncbi:unnamed protein product, partial [Staurois parvus]